jgi:hypothetical protein
MWGAGGVPWLISVSGVPRLPVDADRSLPLLCNGEALVCVEAFPADCFSCSMAELCVTSFISPLLFCFSTLGDL